MEEETIRGRWIHEGNQARDAWEKKGRHREKTPRDKLNQLALFISTY